MNATAQFQDRLNEVAKDIEGLLDRLLASVPANGELVRPPRLLKAMRYASLGAGKRFRPFLVAIGWSVYEYFKSIGFLGYPWGLVAYPVGNVLPLIQFVTNLTEIGNNRFTVVAAPLAIKGGDASPVRVIALVE